MGLNNINLKVTQLQFGSIYGHRATNAINQVDRLIKDKTEALRGVTAETPAPSKQGEHNL